MENVRDDKNRHEKNTNYMKPISTYGIISVPTAKTFYF